MCHSTFVISTGPFQRWSARAIPTGSEAFLELPIALGYGPATGPTLKTALCHIRTLVGRRINTARALLASVLLCPVVGRSRPAVVACCTVRSGVFHHWIHHLWPQGAFPPGFNPLRRGWVYRPAPEAPRKGECRRGSEAFLELPIALGSGPATGPTLNTALCHIRTLVGRRINTARTLLASVLLCPVVGRSRPAVVACCTVRSGVFHHWIHHLWPQGAFPPGFNPLRRGWVYRPAPEAPRKRGMPTGSEAFLELPIALGYGPAKRTHLKHGLVPYSYVGGT